MGENMERRRRNLWTIGAIGISILLFGILGIIQTQKASHTVAVSGDIQTISEGLPAIGGPFKLLDQNGTLRTDADFKGKPMLVYFGYTYCPDICPTALYNITNALNQLGGALKVQPIFITFDPQRDTAQHLKVYAQNFHKDFVLLTGSKQQIDDVVKSYRVYAARTAENRGEEDYLMDHSSLIYLMGKNGQYVANFNHNSPPEEIVKRVKLYLETGKP